MYYNAPDKPNGAFSCSIPDWETRDSRNSARARLSVCCMLTLLYHTGRLLAVLTSPESMPLFAFQSHLDRTFVGSSTHSNKSSLVLSAQLWNRLDSQICHLNIHLVELFSCCAPQAARGGIWEVAK